jgi:hypothetical protein
MTSVITKWVTVHSHYQTFTGQTRSIMGCGRREQKAWHENSEMEEMAKNVGELNI